ncbi:MAG: tyrosinase family protein, partial [Balneolales bacterium]
EGNVVHTGGHQWVGGVMADPNSPLDPVFYFHHGMIDKLWQEWEEEFSASSYVVTSLPRYTAIDPDDITDSRDLKVWYADDGVVLLDQYDTDDTEVYSYTGKINAENDFIVKSGSDVTFTAGESVVLGPGFRAESGSTFLASVDPDVGDILPQVKEDAPMVEPVDNVSQMDKPIEWSLSQNYPNPFNPATHISYSVAERSHVRMAVYTITGRRVATLVNEVRDAGTHTVWFDASRLASGIYIYRIQAGSFIQTRQMTVIK